MAGHNEFHVVSSLRSLLPHAPHRCHLPHKGLIELSGPFSEASSFYHHLGRNCAKQGPAESSWASSGGRDLFFFQCVPVITIEIFMDLSFLIGTQRDQRVFLLLVLVFVSVLIPVIYLSTRKAPRPPRTTTYYPYPQDSPVEYSTSSRQTKLGG